MNNVKHMFSAQARKAIVAGVVAGLGAAIAAADNGITLVEGLTIASTAVGAFQATYWITNAPAQQASPPWVDQRPVAPTPPAE